MWCGVVLCAIMRKMRYDVTDDDFLFSSCNFCYSFQFNLNNNNTVNYLFLFGNKRRMLSRNSSRENVQCLQKIGEERIQFWNEK